HRVANLYGPTEAAVNCTAHAVAADGAPGDGPVPIGRPVANARLYLLDRQGEPCPLGVPGEIHIGGCGVARGYLRRPDLTPERFVPDRFAGAGSGLAGARLYRTGDLARHPPAGGIVYPARLGRQGQGPGQPLRVGEV